jgi:DNA primase
VGEYLISDDVIQKIKDQNDIVDIISETVTLRKVGKNYVGLCPFHHEKTPSFSVLQDKQIFKCFGCGEAGNVFSFLMKSKNLTFPEAIKILAERVNIDIEENNTNKYYKDVTAKMYKLNIEAARYFYGNLLKNKIAVDYILMRGISELTMKRFGLGFSNDSWNSLMNYLKRKGYTELDMVEVGLIVKSEKGNYYDRFRNRLIFPVFDYQGRVVGFGGRVLDNGMPKYLNSPETILFKKGTNLYGLNFAIKGGKLDYIIIVEGYMDCITLHQSGITNVVASLGTALTSNQAKLLKRHVRKVIISYDADLAGQTATLRGLDILRKEGFDIKVLKVPQGKDPDEYVRNNGKDAFLNLIKDAKSLIDYKLDRAEEGLNLKNEEQLMEYIKKISDIVGDVNPVEKDVYIKKISEKTGVKEQAIYDLLKGQLQNNVNKTSEMYIVDNFGQKLFLEPAYLKAERFLLKLMMENKEFLLNIKETLIESELILESHKKIYGLILENANEADIQKSIQYKCDDVESAKEWVSISEVSYVKEDVDIKQMIKDYIREVKKYRLEESKKEIMVKIKSFENKGLLDKSMEMAQVLVNIQKEIGAL